VITYSATLDVPAETATLLTELLVAERLVTVQVLACVS
jgi:hypothetical protein